jgi:hypothetical protein
MGAVQASATSARANQIDESACPGRGSEFNQVRSSRRAMGCDAAFEAKTHKATISISPCRAAKRKQTFLRRQGRWQNGCFVQLKPPLEQTFERRLCMWQPRSATAASPALTPPCVGICMPKPCFSSCPFTSKEKGQPFV